MNGSIALLLGFLGGIAFTIWGITTYLKVKRDGPNPYNRSDGYFEPAPRGRTQSITPTPDLPAIDWSTPESIVQGIEAQIEIALKEPPGTSRNKCGVMIHFEFEKAAKRAREWDQPQRDELVRVSKRLLYEVFEIGEQL